MEIPILIVTYLASGFAIGVGVSGIALALWRALR